MGNYLCLYTENNINTEKDLFRKSEEEGFLERGYINRNILECVKRNYKLLKLMKYDIAMGYMKLNNKVYLKTTVLVKNGLVVDINRHLHKKIEDSEYLIVTELNIDEYIDQIINNKGKVFFGDKEIDRYWDNYFKRKSIKIIN